MNESEKAIRMTMQQSIHQILSERKHRRLSDAELYEQRFGMFEQETAPQEEIGDVGAVKEEVKRAIHWELFVVEGGDVSKLQIDKLKDHHLSACAREVVSSGLAEEGDIEEGADSPDFEWEREQSLELLKRVVSRFLERNIERSLEDLRQVILRWSVSLNRYIHDFVTNQTNLPVVPFCVRLSGYRLSMHDLLPSNYLKESGTEDAEGLLMQQNPYDSHAAHDLLPWDDTESFTKNLTKMLDCIDIVLYKIDLRLASLNMSNQMLQHLVQQDVPDIEERYDIQEPWISKIKSVSTKQVFMTELRRTDKKTEYYFFGKVHRHWVYLFSMTQPFDLKSEFIDSYKSALKNSILRNQDLFLEQFFTFHLNKLFGTMRIMHTFPVRTEGRILTLRYDTPKGVFAFQNPNHLNPPFPMRWDVVVPFDVSSEEQRAAKQVFRLIRQVELYPRHLPLLQKLRFLTNSQGVRHLTDFLSTDSRRRFTLSSWMSKDSFEEIVDAWDLENLMLTDLRMGVYRGTLNDLPQVFHVKHQFTSLHNTSIVRVYYNSGLNRQYDWFAFEDGKPISRSRYFRLKNRKKRETVDTL